MSLFIPTGQTRRVPCVCGVEVEQTEGWVTGTDGTPYWNTQSHNAPCGLPCFGAGVPGRAYSTGEFHHPEGRCPRCAPDAVNPPPKDVVYREPTYGYHPDEDMPTMTPDQIRLAYQLALDPWIATRLGLAEELDPNLPRLAEEVAQDCDTEGYHEHARAVRTLATRYTAPLTEGQRSSAGVLLTLDDETILPDLADPTGATEGVLRQALRECPGTIHVRTRYSRSKGGWVVNVDDLEYSQPLSYRTEVEAIGHELLARRKTAARVAVPIPPGPVARFAVEVPPELRESGERLGAALEAEIPRVLEALPGVPVVEDPAMPPEGMALVRTSELETLRAAGWPTPTPIANLHAVPAPDAPWPHERFVETPGPITTMCPMDSTEAVIRVEVEGREVFGKLTAVGAARWGSEDDFEVRWTYTFRYDKARLILPTEEATVSDDTFVLTRVKSYLGTDACELRLKPR